MGRQKHATGTIFVCIMLHLLISAYDAPYMRRGTNHAGAATRLGTCVSANNDVFETAIE